MPAIPPSSAEPGFVRKDITIFNFFASLGVISIIAVLAPALFSPRIKRSATWYGELTSWLVYSVSYILLFGHQLGPKPPPHGLCMFQAVLVYAMPPLYASSVELGASLIIQLGVRLQLCALPLMYAFNGCVPLAMALGDTLLVSPQVINRKAQG